MERKGGGGQGNVHLKGLVAGLIVVVGAAVAWWLLRPDASATVAKGGDGTAGRRIREVKPAVRVKPAAVTNVAKGVDSHTMPTSPGQYLNGYRMLANGRLHKVHSIVTNSTRKTSVADRAFTEESDLAIGYLLMVRPGQPLLGSGAEYYQTFTEDFLESLKTPIVIDKDDDDDIKAMKADVIAIRKDLKARYDAGEDLVKIMRETRDQLQEIAIYRKEIEKMVAEHGVNIDNQQDYDDLIGAANKMLEERGSEPLVLPKAFRSTVREWQREARAEQEQKQQQEGTDK